MRVSYDKHFKGNADRDWLLLFILGLRTPWEPDPYTDKPIMPYFEPSDFDLTITVNGEEIDTLKFIDELMLAVHAEIEFSVKGRVLDLVSTRWSRLQAQTREARKLVLDSATEIFELSLSEDEKEILYAEN